jgi:hypothetical protein
VGTAAAFWSVEVLMVRGPSKLQRCILKLAEKKNPATYWDVLVHYFKWKVLPVGRTVYVRPGLPLRFCRDRRTADGRPVYIDKPQWFDEEAIGRKAYLAAVASISRACSRLRQRGLIERKDGASGHALEKFDVAIRLTPQGREFLMVKTDTAFNR